MLPQDFQELLRQQPFLPLKLHLSNGKQYEIRHPEIAAVRLSVVWLYLPSDITKPIGNNIAVVTLQQIVEVELLPLGSPGKGNGAVT